MLNDLIAKHPELIAMGCLSWVIVVVWVIHVINRMIMLELDIVFGVLAIGVVVGLGFMAIAPPVPVLQPLSIVLLVLSAVMIPITRGIQQQREHRNVDVEGVEKAYEGFVLRPSNPAAQIRLARHLYNLGVRGHALVLAEGALPGLPRRYFPDEYRMVENWRQYPPDKGEFEPIGCVECGHANAAGTIHCAACGARFLLDRVKGRVVSTQMGRKLMVAWIVMILCAVGIALASEIQGPGALVVIFVIAVGAVGTLALAFRDKESTA
ncbi:hypothetical protein OP10G_3338 [Fimbriimonas ginsengisoli Gsoil 348]|uniref:Uncharacterized protein n=2 Tax=Fimbriimonas ginsengisoli TaxID=1005039 RepID=A0A068NTE3_FIMGI|nr:hypothetical protein OP10G_3338 [Fimbriimonas ginsengisoli Gsoil 348]